MRKAQPYPKTYSERAYKRNVYIRSERSQGERRDKRRAYVTHKPILQRLQQVAIVCFWSLCSFSHTPKTALIFLTRTQVRLFLTCGSPCVQYERLRRVVAEPAHKAWWHKKGTIPIYASADFPSLSDVYLKRESTMFEKSGATRKAIRPVDGL